MDILVLFNIFKGGIVPHNRPQIESLSSVLVTHAEVERDDYNYAWNSDGIRSVEFATRPRIVALGCSITLGQGLPVELRWSDLLSKMIGEPIGNISYSGGSISQIVSSFIGMVKQYDYIPEYVICNFAPLDRFYFISGDGESLKDYSPKPNRKVKDSAPWDYASTIPYEWAYYNSLNYLQILEVFCRSNGIKLVWSTWSNALTKDQEDFLLSNFQSYVPDPVRKQFPSNFEFFIDAKEVGDLVKFYKMKDWSPEICHSDYSLQYPDIFDHAYDYHKNGKAPDKKITRTPHPGLHKHLHWADFYYQEFLRLT